ncbi:uncharacterized protein TNIN_236521 [Trichonephila inaurata madagascariensis]|uniref:Autophagy-related protein 27 n=1 Tax=Trichonephila inaurata madagascariensis TaxID=2747483 RepID=A0A8X6YU83_9ARAC|nr:uncharacterized protein TNIN_236521 [Trichonephila inaurata madagascariensis]
MFIKGFIFSLFFVEVFVSATNVCSIQTPCRCDIGGGEALDLSSVGLTGKPLFNEILAGNGTVNGLYSYNPCYAFDSTDTGTTVKQGNVPCKNAAACVKTPGGEHGEFPEEHAIGIQSTAKFHAFSADGKDYFSIMYTVPGAQQNLTVILNCSESDDYHLTIDSIETPENSSVVMTLNTKCACRPYKCLAPTPEESSHGLSTGSKLLIAFFTIAGAYFLVGIIWNFCNGAQGVELVPNLDFWNELPKLIIEGVIFTCSCFGRKSSYGEV